MKKIDLNQLETHASSKAMRVKLYDTISRMEASPAMGLENLRRIAEAESIDYTSVRTVIGAFVALEKPRTYLEIGTRRGHSLCMAVNCSSQPLDIYSFDLWIPNYAGEENPGEALIRKELEKFQFSGQIDFHPGDSKETIPAFFENPANPQELDCIFVDGDHSAEGARIDLLNVIPHIAKHGLLVFDDVTHPQHRYLLDVWREVMQGYPNFTLLENTRHEYGWVIAQRNE